MYAEQHYFQNRTTQWLKWTISALAFWQLTAILGAETGLPWLPLGYLAHLSLLLFAVVLLVFLRNKGLKLQITKKGWTLRRVPALWYTRQISWAEIKNVRLLKSRELALGQNLSLVEHQFGQLLMISNPAYSVACIELVNGFQVFVSIKDPQALLDFLHKGLLLPDLKQKVVD